MNFTHPLILASNSPRRRELLKQAGFTFDVFVRDFDESFPEEMPAEQVAEFLAVKKNKNYRELLDEQVVITADTTVVLGRQVLNKPTDHSEAFRMLKSLSGNTHQVICGVCISSPSKQIAFTEITEVTFGQISDEEINFYIEEYQPFDKAGAYGIQEWIGQAKVVSIKGSYFNVMGLPTHKVYEVLKSEFKDQI
ncbi:Maf family protein [Marinoscillum sp.]|uniref:Maf family protein n=1 Tax=Marinoscillum sp. TaxID=2024838 RepID=UPI003BAD56F3